MFVIKKTKSEFERELKAFVGRNGQVDEVLGWRVLRRRRTEAERCFTQYEKHYQEWDYITNIAEADAIKLTVPPFRGLVLEIDEWPKLAIDAEGERESVTVAEDGVWHHKRYRHVAVNTEAQAALSTWLRSLETPEANSDKMAVSDVLLKQVIDAVTRETEQTKPTTADVGAGKVGRPPLTDAQRRERFETVEKVLKKKRRLGITEEQACAREAVPYSTYKDWKRTWRKRRAMDD